MTDQSPTPASEFVLVPREPTEAIKAAMGLWGDEARLTWARIIAAARPTPADDAQRREGPAIPEGMVPWHGGDSAPEDWDGGPVMLHGRSKPYLQPPGQPAFDWGRSDVDAESDIIAYTPKPRATEAARWEDGELTYEVWQSDAFGDGDGMVAGSDSLKGAQHYCAVYGQDGPAWIVEVLRRPLTDPNKPWDSTQPRTTEARLRELVEESLFHLRLDSAAEAYHHRALAALRQADGGE